MSVINTNAKEIHCKVLYYGPEQSGKKSSLLYIRDHFKKEKVKFFTLPLKKEICCLVISIDKVFDFQIYIHVYNLNNESQTDNQTLFKGVDGIVFVASSKPEDREKNLVSFLEMENFFQDADKNPFKVPLVLQYNKKDLKPSIPLKELRMDLNKYNSRDFESSVLEGKFILEPLKYLCKLILSDLKTANF